MTSSSPDEPTLFECTQCGTCCQGYGGTAVSEEDMRDIAWYLGIEVDEFRERYCVLSGNKFMLAQKDDGYCIFYDRNCSIHPVKPKMCRRWPFIDSLLVDISNWYIMADCCPGMNRALGTETLFEKIKDRFARNPSIIDESD
jgi:Fe-S-cluster containining protein